MVETDLINLYQNLGFGAVFVIAGISFVRWWSMKAFQQIELSSNKAFEQVDDANKRAEVANKRVEESHQKFIEFIDDTYKENTKTMQAFLSEFKEHIRVKDQALDLLKDQQDALKDELNIIKRFHKIDT